VIVALPWLCESLATVAVIETFYDPSKVVEPVTSPAKLIVLAVCSLDYVEALPDRLNPVIVLVPPSLSILPLI